MLIREPYSGKKEKLVLAFDVGTTFSGVSYCILEPGAIPVVNGVFSYPAQERIGGDSKIPTTIYYDQSGNVQAVGAETIGEEIEQAAEDNKWFKAEWFKLHLRPKKDSTAFVSETIPVLPPVKSAVSVFADFLHYLYECTRAYIEKSHSGGTTLWRNLKADTEFVLTHPNGWEVEQQALMRKAAIMAGLIAATDDGHARLSFVTEGEAGLHFCIQSGLASEAIKDGRGILIVDAGGGTIDISAYTKTSDPHSYEEITIPQCAFKGSIFVTKSCGNFLENLLGGSKFAESIPLITEIFDKTAKLRFKSGENLVIRFGGLGDNAPEFNIKSGQLRLLGTDVANFFEPSLTTIIEMIEKQCSTAKAEISSIFVIGGFGSNCWLFKNLKDTFEPRGMDVCAPNGRLNKAVADGAVSYYIDHLVRTRIAKYSFGGRADISYDPSNSEHTARRHWIYTNVRGRRNIRNVFSIILPKNTSVSETEEFRKSYSMISRDSSSLNTITDSIICFRGSRDDPRWLDEESELYSILCVIEGNLSHVPKRARYSDHIHDFYYEVSVDVVLSFGLTEFKAFLAWNENGVEKRGPATLVFGPDKSILDGAER